MSVNLPPEAPQGTPPSTATEAAPKLSNALEPNAPGDTRDAPADAEYRRNSRPPDWINPTDNSFYDVIVLGGGPAGIVAALRAAQMGRTVALVERSALGGRCLAAGGVPTQALIATARHVHQIRQSEVFGITQAPDPAACFAEAMERVRQTQATVSRQNSAREISRLGVDVYFAEGRFALADAIAVDNRTLRFRRALIATGGRQRALDIPGADAAGYLTMESLLALKTLPGRLLVIGCGPLGTEMAQVYCRLGSDVTLVQSAPKFLPGEERDAAQILSASLARDGVRIRLNTAAVAIRRQGDTRVVTLQSSGHCDDIEVDAILAAVGQQTDATSLNLGVADINVDADGSIAVDDYLRTSNHRVYAAGDVCMKQRYTQVAETSARLAITNALGRPTARMSKMVLPWCTYTDPEVGHVGMHVQDAHARNTPMKTYTVLMHEVDRALAEGERVGFAKIHTELGTDRILGATIVGRNAGDIIDEVTLAMQRQIGLRALADVVTAFPTRSQTVQLAAQACVTSMASDMPRQNAGRRRQGKRPCSSDEAQSQSS